MGNQIPKCGNVTLENGELLFKKYDGEIVGRVFIGPDGPVLQGEMTQWQDEDPPKWRFASSYASWRGTLGAVSFNVVRPDGRQDEVAFIRGCLAEDVQPGELRGQVETRIAMESDQEPKLAQIITTAYTLAEYGVRKIMVCCKGLMNGLWKFE